MGKWDKCVFVPPTPFPMVNVEQENGVAAVVVVDKNCEGGNRDAPRLIESDNGDRLQLIACNVKTEK